MIETFCDRDRNGEVVTRFRLCPDCRVEDARTEEGYPISRIGPYQQWRIFGWIRRLAAAWDLTGRGDLVRNAFRQQTPEGWVPVYCPKHESRDLGRTVSVPASRTPTSVIGVDTDEPPPPEE